MLLRKESKTNEMMKFAIFQIEPNIFQLKWLKLLKIMD